MNFPYCEKELQYLSDRDKNMAIAVKMLGKIERKTDPDLFSALIQNIVGQQISNKAFETVWQRFKDYFNEITPQKINDETLENIQKLGVSQKKAAYIKNIAAKVAAKELDFEILSALSDEDATAELMKLDGVGKWTAEMLLLFSMMRKNVFSYGDFAIRRGLQILHNHKEITKPIFEKYRKLYSPYCSAASFYLWEIGNSNLKKFPSFLETGDVFAAYASPIGKIILASDKKNLTGLFFGNISVKESDSPIFDETKAYLDAYFANKPLPSPPKIKFRGTDFQKKVWNELKKIPYGSVTTYKELAKSLNTSPRSVGGAVGKNPVALIAPCHRVIGADDTMTGYAWGIDIKEKLLKIEQKNGL